VAVDAAVALEDEECGGDLVEEVAVVGDHQDAAGEVDEGRLQDLEGEEVQVVGGLVQDEEVGVLEEEPGQEQAVDFSPPERLRTFCSWISLGKR
jgi:hypothetical protein